MFYLINKENKEKEVRQEPQKKLRNHKTGFGAFSFYLLNLNLLFTLNYADRIP